MSWGILWGLALLSALVIRLIHLQKFTYDTFLDRDLYRALVTDDKFWFYGSELSGGGRTPGGFQNIYLYVLSLLTNSSVLGIHTLSVALGLGSCLYLAYVLRQKISPSAAAWYLLLSLCTHTSLEQTLVFWNPTMAVPFINVAYATLILYLTSEKPRQTHLFLLVGGVFTGLAAQFHTSNNILILIFLLFVIFFKSTPWSQKLRSLTALIVGYLITFLPYLIHRLHAPESAMTTYVPNSSNNLLQINLLYIQQFLATFFHSLGLILPDINEGLQWNFRDSLKDLGGLRYFFYSLSFLPLILGGLGFLLFLKTQSKKSVAKILTVVFILLLATHLLLNLGQTSHEMNVRRFLWLSPLILLVVARSLHVLREKFSFFQNHQRAVIGLCGAFIIGQYFYYFHNLDMSRSPETYLYKSELLVYLKDQDRLKDQDIHRKTALIARENYNGAFGPFILKTLKTHDGSGMETLLWRERLQHKIQTVPQGNELCVGTIRGHEKDLRKIGTPESLETFINSIQPDLTHKIGNFRFGKEGVYFTYEAPDHNCYSYFLNYYYIEAQSHVLELKAKGPQPQGQLNRYGCREHLFQEQIEDISYDILLELCDRNNPRQSSVYMTHGAFMAWEDQPSFVAQNKLLNTQVELRIENKVIYSGYPLQKISKSPSKDGPFLFTLPEGVDLSQNPAVKLQLDKLDHPTY